MKIEFISEKSFLKNIIVGYSILEASSISDFNSSGETIPDGFVELFFSRYDPIGIKMNCQSHSVLANSGFILGQTAKKIAFQPAGKIEMIGIKIHPWATRFFLQDKAILFSEKSSSIDDLGNEALIHLQDQILHSKTRNEAIEYIKDYTIELIKKKHHYSELVFNAVNYIYLNYKDFKVKKLSNLLNISNQYLERQFLEHIGISPKQFAKVIRIRSLTEFHKKQPRVSLTDLAYNFGYFDQSHFIKDFQTVTNSSPKAFFNCNHMVHSDFHSGLNQF